MKKKPFFVILFMLPFVLFAQKQGDVGIAFSEGNNNWGKGYFFITWVDPNINENYIGNNYLKYADIITHVDGVDVHNIAREKFMDFCKGDVGSKVEFTVNRMGCPEPIKIAIKRKASLNALWGPYYFSTKINYNLGSSVRHSWIMRQTNDAESSHQILSDKEIDFLAYKTFDFEYTNQKQPLIEKELSSVIENILESKGLARDKENPDFLVFIDFFSDKKEQYVPPTEKLYTRYNTTYNIWTKSWETRKNIQSRTEGDYTRTEYLTVLKIAFMDANRTKLADNKVPPVIWEATYERTENEKTTILNKAKEEYPLLLKSYPVIAWQFDLAYNDWGIYVDRVNPNKIAKIIPGSYAEKIGLQENDIIVMVRKVDRAASYREYKESPMFYLFEYDKQLWSVYKIRVNRDGKNKTLSISYKDPQPSVERLKISLPQE